MKCPFDKNGWCLRFLVFSESTSLLFFFTGGVFLGAGMLHMLPDAEQEAKLVGLDSFPWVYFMACLGFLFVWAVESSNLGYGPDHHAVAVSTAAMEAGGGNLCFVDVAPVATYPKKHGGRPGVVARGISNELRCNKCLIIFYRTSPLLHFLLCKSR